MGVRGYGTDRVGFRNDGGGRADEFMQSACVNRRLSADARRHRTESARHRQLTGRTKPAGAERPIGHGGVYKPGVIVKRALKLEGGRLCDSLQHLLSVADRLWLRSVGVFLLLRVQCQNLRPAGRDCSINVGHLWILEPSRSWLPVGSRRAAEVVLFRRCMEANGWPVSGDSRMVMVDGVAAYYASLPCLRQSTPGCARLTSSLLSRTALAATRR